MEDHVKRYNFRKDSKSNSKNPVKTGKTVTEVSSPKDKSIKTGKDEATENISSGSISNDPKPDESLNGSKSSSTSVQNESNEKNKTTKTKQDDARLDNTKNSQQKLLTIFFIVLIAVLIVICLHTIVNTKDIPQEPVARPSFQQFKDDKIKKLKNEFPSQDSKQFWKVVNAPIRRMFIEEDPSYPAILLFAIPKGPTASLTGSCLAHQLTKHLNVFHGRNEAFIDIDKDLTHTNAAGDKRELDDKLINLYGVKESKSVAVDHFEKLSPLATLLFHGYCDGDHAPYKNVSMVLVLHTDINHEDILRDKSAVDNFLQNLWAKELDGDKIPPLISRIANNVAIVTPEEEYSIKKLCPWL